MDQIKIGKYLSEKRRNLGLTQAQLAEKLNMSDKSVSKWERGVCLPDVSLYQELCSILGISVNEFLAGEDISSDNLEKKAEDTIIQVAEDSKHRQKHLKRVAGVFIAVAVIALAAFIVILSLYRGNRLPRNYFIQVKDSGIETYTLFTGQNAYMYHFAIPDKYSKLEIWCREYQNGELCMEEKIVGMGEDIGIGPHEGTVFIALDYSEKEIRWGVKTKDRSLTSQLDILDGFEQNGLTYTWLDMDEPVSVNFGKEQSLGALVFDYNGFEAPSLAFLTGPDSKQMEILKNNDCVYYFSFIAEA